MTHSLQLNAEDADAVATAISYQSTTRLPNSVMMALLLQWHDSRIITALKERKIEDTSLLRKYHPAAWRALQQLAKGESVDFADPEITDPVVGGLGQKNHCEPLENFLDALRYYRDRETNGSSASQMKARKALIDTIMLVDEYIWTDLESGGESGTASDSLATYDFVRRATEASHDWAEHDRRPAGLEAAGLAYFAVKLTEATLNQLVALAEGTDPDTVCRECELEFDTEGCCACTIFIGDDEGFIPVDRADD